LPSISTQARLRHVRPLQVVASMLDVLHTTDASIGEVMEPAAVEATSSQWPHAHRSVLTVPGAHVSPRRANRRYESSLLPPASALRQHRRQPPNAKLIPPRRHQRHRPHFIPSISALLPMPYRKFKVQTGSYSAGNGGRRRPNQYRHPRRHRSIPRTAYEFLRKRRHGRSHFGDMGAPNFSCKIILRVPRRPSHNQTFFFVNYEGLAKNIQRPMP